MTEAEFLAQYTLPDEERKRLLLGNALLGLGSGLMQSKRGGELTNAGLGLFAGVQQGQNAALDAQKGQIDKFKLKQMWQEQEQKKALADQQAAGNADIAKLFQPQNPTADMPSRAPTTDNAANIPVAPQKYEIYLAAAEKAMLNRDPVGAKHWADLAEKHKPKYSTSPQIGVDSDGKPYQFVLNEDGSEKRLTAGAVPKFREVQRGGAVDIVNDYNLPATGASFAKTLTPEGVQSGQQWQADYALRRNADQRAADAAGRANEVKPQWDAGSGQFVYPPTKENPTGAAVAPKGYTPKQERPSDQQLATGGFLDRMQFASKYIDALEKKGYEPGAGQAAVTALGKVPLVGGMLGYAAESGQNYAAPESAAYKNAQEAWIRAKLRKESGAVIGVDEMEGERRTFFPQPNDPPEVRKQKAALRKQVEVSMVKQARGGFQGGAGQEDPLGLR